MTLIHGKSAVVTIATNDISPYTNSVELKRAGDSHDITCFGATGHAYQGGLTDGTLSLKGVYDSGTAATIPRKAFQGNLGASLAFVYEAAGAGSGNPKVAGSGILTAYEESAPVADMVTWSAELQITGAVTTTDLP
jgi:hypothetical protein